MREKSECPDAFLCQQNFVKICIVDARAMVVFCFLLDSRNTLFCAFCVYVMYANSEGSVLQVMLFLVVMTSSSVLEGDHFEMVSSFIWAPCRRVVFCENTAVLGCCACSSGLRSERPSRSGELSSVRALWSTHLKEVVVILLCVAV